MEPPRMSVASTISNSLYILACSASFGAFGMHQNFLIYKSILFSADSKYLRINLFQKEIGQHLLSVLFTIPSGSLNNALPETFHVILAEVG